MRQRLAALDLGLAMLAEEIAAKDTVEPELAAHRDLDRFGRMVQRPRVGLPAERQALVDGRY